MILGAIAALLALLTYTVRLVARQTTSLTSPLIFRLWFRKSLSLLLGTLAYNIFAIAVLTPTLRKYFPPLSPLEQVKGFLGAGTRTTYRELLPYIGPAVWIAGNALLFALLNRKLNQVTKKESLRP